MKINKIPYSFDTVNKILHIADIHIRNYQRHKEYKSIFKKLYSIIDKLPPESIVYVGGDIVHSKTDISPELIRIVSDFLDALASRRTTIVIAGNHDANLNNLSRLDALSPIIERIDNDNLHYLKDSGVYKIGNVHFTVFGIFDSPSSFIKSKDFEADTKVALFHGAVDKSVTDTGYRVSNKDLPISMFDGYDMSMLGDIHKRQFYNDDSTILQPGSLIQQNFGESYENHGCTIWDVETRTPKFTNIKNEFGFYTLEISNGKLPSINDIPKFPRIRIRHSNTTQAQLKTIVKEIRTVCRPTDVIPIRMDKISTLGASKTSQVLSRNIRDVNYQNELLYEYIYTNHNVDDSVIDEVHKINKNLNTGLSGIEITRNVNWKAKLFEFSNMFSYGGNNKIDFTKANGIVGLFASNHSGKSSILDSLSFCIFDKCSRGRTALDIMNNRKASFQCKFTFEISGQDYFIEREAKKQKNGSVKVLVNFWTIESGNIISLNGEQRRDTNRSIRSLLGTYDDFVLTSLSVQNNSTGFIDKSQTEKKDLLAQFLDISIFEELYQLANDEVKEVSVLLKTFKNVDYDEQLIDQETKLLSLASNKIDVSDKLKLKKDEIKSVTDTIASLNKDLINLSSKLDIDSLNENKSLEEANLITLEEHLSDEIESKVNIESKLIVINDKLNLIDIDKIKTEHKAWEQHNTGHNTVIQKIELLKVSVKAKIDKLNAIGQFDPDCDFCKNTPFVQSAFKIKKDLDNDKGIVSNLLSDRDILKSKLDTCANRYSDIEDYNNLISELSKYSNVLMNIKSNYSVIESNIVKSKSKIQSIVSDITLYETHKKSIIHNQRVQLKIDECIRNVDLLDIAYDKINSELQDIISDMKVSTTKVSDINNHINQAHQLELKLKAYEYYLDAVKRNGIPYTIISDVLPHIESEVNQILSQIVDFRIEFNVDGKNILTHIAYGDDKWPLELTSGMEKFVASLAIRVALINISNLPRPNFLCVDEGFGNLDSQNISSLDTLFDCLKVQFDFIFIISHIDVMRDMTDDLIEIDKIKGFSKVIY